MNGLGAVFGEVLVALDGFEAETPDEGQGGVAEGGEDLGSIGGAGAALVFAAGDVANMVEAVLDAPVGARQLEKPFGPGLVARQAGDGVDDLDAFLGPDGTAPGDAADLGDTGPAVEIFGQAGAAFQATDFQAAVALAGGFVAVEVRRWRPCRRGGNPARRPGRCRLSGSVGCPSP